MIQTIIACLLLGWAFVYFIVKMVYPFVSKQNKSACNDCVISPANRPIKKQKPESSEKKSATKVIVNARPFSPDTKSSFH